MALGSGNIGTNQRQFPQNGPPFIAGSARNGTSIDLIGTVVLGQDVGDPGNPAILLNNREIPMNGFSFAFTDNFKVQPQGTYFLGDDAAIGNGTEIILRDAVPDVRILTLIGAASGVNALSIIGGATPTFAFGDVGINNKGLRLFLDDGNDRGYIQNALRNSRIGINIDPALVAAQFNPAFLVACDQGTNSESTFLRFGAVSACNEITTRKTRGITPGVLTPIVAGDQLFSLAGRAVANDNLYHLAARIISSAVQVNAASISSQIFFQVVNLAGATLNAMYLGSEGQLGIGTVAPNASAQVQIDSTARGFAQPRMTTAQKNAIAAPLIGLSLFDTTLNQPAVYDGAWKSVLIGNDGAAAPATLAAVAPANVYGAANGNYLGDPVAWAQVTINGTLYKLPLYT